MDLLIGLDRSSLHPKAVCSIGDLTLYESLFGTGWVLGGTDPALKQSSLILRQINYGMLSSLRIMVSGNPM